MGLLARDVMVSRVKTVEPSMNLAELERSFLEDRVSGFPVVEGGRLVGLVSRSDVVRQLSVERSRAEQLSDRSDAGSSEAPAAERLSDVSGYLSARLETLTVRDAMIHDPVTVAPETPIREVAALLVEKHIHRLPVVDGAKLVGILSSLDLVRLVADARVREV